MTEMQKGLLIAVAIIVWLVWLSNVLEKRLYKPDDLSGAANQLVGSFVACFASALITTIVVVMIVVIYFCFFG